MAVTVRKMTLEEYRALPDDGNRYELIDGELLVTAAPTTDHQDLLAVTYRLLFAATEARGLGKIFFAPTEIRFPGGSIVQPDLVYLRQDRLYLRKRAAILGAPDLIVEVLSPSTRDDLGKKRRLYEAEGVPEYWVVESVRAGLRIFALARGRYVEVEAVDGKVASTVVPGLVVDPVALYADAIWQEAE